MGSPASSGLATSTCRSLISKVVIEFEFLRGKLMCADQTPMAASSTSMAVSSRCLISGTAIFWMIS